MIKQWQIFAAGSRAIGAVQPPPAKSASSHLPKRGLQQARNDFGPRHTGSNGVEMVVAASGP
jgi:hypothetical protein